MRKILSIDGGGIRGIIPALVLAEIEGRTGHAAAEMFDLIVGTSTGGIIACCLCRAGTETRGNGDAGKKTGLKPKYSAAELAEMYSERGREIFQRSFWRGISSVGGLADEKYTHTALEQILMDYMGGTVMEEALTALMVTTYDIERRLPYMIKSWRDEHKAVPMRHAARATSAAPTYFEPAIFQADDDKVAHALVDGGVCVNNPAMCAYAEARRMWPGEEIMVVSLGTGEATRPIPYHDALDWGLAEWAMPVLSIMMDGAIDAVDYQLRAILGSELYYRYQVQLKTASDDMDNASRANVEALWTEAARIVERQDRDLDKTCAALNRG